MKYSARKLKNLLTFFPPLLFNGIRIKKISQDYTEAIVSVRKSILNRNFEKSIFGGSIFCAADPFYNILFWQYFNQKGMDTVSFLKGAKIEYLKAARSRLSLHFQLNQTQLDSAEDSLRRSGKYTAWHSVKAIDPEGDVCALIDVHVYLRLKNQSA